jgi:signal transduction histidine kinase
MTAGERIQSRAEPHDSPDRIAHDLNNLLGIVLGFTDMVINDLAPDDPRHDDLLEIRKATQTAISLIERFRAATRAETQP